MEEMCFDYITYFFSIQYIILQGEGKNGPGIYCLCMHQIIPRKWEVDISLHMPTTLRPRNSVLSSFTRKKVDGSQFLPRSNMSPFQKYSKQVSH